MTIFVEMYTQQIGAARAVVELRRSRKKDRTTTATGVLLPTYRYLYHVPGTCLPTAKDISRLFLLVVLCTYMYTRIDVRVHVRDATGVPGERKARNIAYLRLFPVDQVYTWYIVTGARYLVYA